MFCMDSRTSTPVALQPGHEKVAWYRLLTHARNIRYIFRKIVLSTSYHLNTEYYMNQEYGHCQRMMLASLLVEHAAADRGHFEDKQNG